MDSILSMTFLLGLLAATLRVATPLVYATLGEVFTERAGILNLGIEGIMFLGAFIGFAAAYKANEAGLAGYLWIGLFSAILSGILMGLLMGFFSVTLGTNTCLDWGSPCCARAYRSWVSVLCLASALCCLPSIPSYSYLPLRACLCWMISPANIY